MSQQESSEKKKIFSTRLKALRQRRGLGQEELAARIDVSAGSIGNWEGKNPNFPQFPTLRKLAKFFECSVEYLRGEEEILMGEKMLGESRMYGFEEGIGSVGEVPTEEVCQKHLDQFLKTCDKNSGKLGWTLWELKDKFPLDKWKNKK